MKKSKLALLAVTLPMIATALTGCSGGGGEKEDSTKFCLNIASWDGGVGTQWLKNAISRFEAKMADYTDTSKSATKKGVQILIDASRNYAGENLLNSSLSKDIYFTENIDYYNCVNSNKFMDMTDVITEPLTDYGEDKTILSKMDDAMASFLNYKSTGKYYAIPFYDGFYGFVYNIDLWASKGFYIKKDSVTYNDAGEVETISWTGDVSQGHEGPDGVSGTYDDGLPATYAELAELISKIKRSSITPFLGSDKGKDYPCVIFDNYFANYEGIDEMKTNYTFSGTAHHLIPRSITDPADVKPENYETKDITWDNGYDMTRQAGRYQSLHVLKDIVAADAQNYKIIESHTDAQNLFVSTSKYAMIMEGSWWENEASDCFKVLAESGKTRSNYAIMPIPHANDSVDPIGKKQTTFCNNYSYGFISASTSYPELCKEFMKFVHTDEELSHFTAETSMTRPLNYDIAESDQDKLTTYAQSLINLKKTADIIYPLSTLEKVINHSSDFIFSSWCTRTLINGTDRNASWEYLRTTDCTAMDYFRGEYDYYYKNWSTFR